jgi:hypothetical protein
MLPAHERSSAGSASNIKLRILKAGAAMPFQPIHHTAAASQYDSWITTVFAWLEIRESA